VSVAVTVLRVPPGEGELGADRLMSAGAFAVEERELEATIELRAVLGDDAAGVADRLGTLPEGWQLDTEHVDSEPLDTWRQFAELVWVTDDLVLRPAWLPAIERPGVTEVAIEPGAAFGLGDHPTTRLSAAAVWRTAGGGDAVLDVGCGTGALAIVGALAGAARVVAIDIAQPAVAVTAANAAANGVADRVEASTAALAVIDGQFDVVVANILAPALIDLAGELRRVTAASGALIVSGLLAGRFEHVAEALHPMRVSELDELEGWAALVLRHPG
jgi:ribosomal protein L11 methyltransferase